MTRISTRRFHAHNAIVLLGVIISVILAAWFGWQYYSSTEAKLRKATILTEKQANPGAGRGG
ncbi:MAG: hypothetical protein ACRDBM_04735 [Sporomusa sp.]